MLPSVLIMVRFYAHNPVYAVWAPISNRRTLVNIDPLVVLTPVEVRKYIQDAASKRVGTLYVVNGIIGNLGLFPLSASTNTTKET